MKLGIRRLTAAVLAATLATGVFGATAFAEPAAPVEAAPAEAATGQDRAALQQAMGELASAGVAGVQVRVHDQQGDWTGSSGVKELGRDEKVPTNGRFRAGSITKTFLSTVVLQLVGEGKLKLDDPVAKYLPQFGLDKRITVRMILQHTSGIFNYTGDTDANGKNEPGIPLEGSEFLKNRYRTYQPEELVRFALSKPARFEPNSEWRYSNTNYILAGLLVEKVTGRSYASQVEQRILRPLRLWETTMPGTRFGIPGPHAHGYYSYKENGKLETVDITRLNPSWGGAAGEIISTTRDLDRFNSALQGGKLLKPELLDLMRQERATRPGSGYGLGLEVEDTGPSCAGKMYGHTGGIHGYNSFMFSNADRSRRFEMSVTTGSFDIEDPATRDKLVKALNKVVNIGFCGKAASGENAAQPTLQSLKSLQF
ncbi:serine hydrolase domain-containing protein [Streptoalloteichus hindustanus]|uniref:D-alanyl-D-alanine carboxypeptidase n=1 Tax=Streptoalloteichus hindustanus TaxID=2017 RepID=A0A1M4Z957_STRHI|nr:serine hydrolase domain-containing protein [Streptoalloteichus hindustanus]SHF14478.1 D-alanyl-D-alanine carboxypeptidase [Streptoalloteichus hindustanus]